ncbi:hypothetical protein LV164_008598 [Aspergillus fumigatus]|nr:hypothetical protein KXX56_000299 [Aspergillus fumigatus]KAH2008355.1 hypothetical protein KXV97_002077 [Aspergillus fumigatus]KAH2378301.1 hypothetical protein KXV62_009602 [Aspergillus fumigatus]KAH3199779.1 hypothetical protein KXW62_000710 [Aspergillus fumigatus]KAH3303285.1 hypothetical protein KXV87_001939 [Aspergillus fumigatus]
MSNRETAKKAVEEIGEKLGHVSPAILDRIGKLLPEERRIIEQSLRAKDEKIGHSIKTLAKNLYNSNARFVFELLQNADDNRFTLARKHKELPFISFKVYPDRIVVECNEDGFSIEDLSAICSVGESTKAASHGYIGAKGIGFKSVFIAAWKVHIQSGNFSFHFKHRRGDLGLGMVLPVWEDPEYECPDRLTRMTLYLHTEGEPHALEHLRKTIFQQLSDLQQTSLLFLRNIKQIGVFFYDGNGGMRRSKTFRVRDAPGHSVFLDATVVDGDENSTTVEQRYHVTRRTATELPTSDNRNLLSTLETNTAFSEAEVVLAFPLTVDSRPLLEKQEIFAFLPVRESRFKFLIQSDFDTSANRQDISTTSRRNLCLLPHIASAFVMAVLEFCEDPELCYAWPSFLPSLDDDMGDFWSPLARSIRDLIAETPVWRSRHGNSLRVIDSIMILPEDFMDSDGNPLLDDSSLDPFISTAYPAALEETLKEYGLRVGSFDLILRMLKSDLESSTSRVKSHVTSADFHSRISQLLSTIANEHEDGMRTLNELAILPLRNGEWVPANSGPVYLPKTGEIDIPADVDFRILDPAAVANEDRRALFTHLGAVELSVSAVRSAILANYRPLCNGVCIEDSRVHLRYLYLTHNRRQIEEDFCNVCVYCDHGTMNNPHEEEIYLPHSHPYGPKALLGPTEYSQGMEVLLMHSTYFESIPSRPHSDYPSWRAWLTTSLGIRERLSLVSSDGDSLSDSWTYIAETRPGKLLGLLQYLWKYQSSELRQNADLIMEIQSMNARKLCNRDLPDDCRLDETYLPLSNLRALCHRFMEEDEPFPFLYLEELLDEELYSKWIFLHNDFSVGKDDDMGFLLNVLYWIQSANPDESALTSYERLWDLYITIGAKHLAAEDRVVAGDKIKFFFSDGDYIFVPKLQEDDPYDAAWAGLEQCLWDAPPNMISKYSLKYVFEQVVGEGQLEHLSQFFRHTLSIPDASWSDLTGELVERSQNHCVDFDQIFHMREFEDESLIFVTTNGEPGWYKISECLWSSTTDIRGKVTLNDHYEDLKDFFIDTLGVNTLTLRMVYDELLETSSESAIDETKSKIWSLNALLLTDGDYVDPDLLLERSVFPVVYPDGTKGLTSAATEFAIPDREHLASQFRGKIKILDFSLEEVRRLKGFFEWTNLTHRYLSASIKELTSFSGEATQLISAPHRDLRRKAHAILRVAATFNSPRYCANPSGLYELLRTARIEATDGVFSILRISQDGVVADVEELIGKLHISEEPSGLVVYVPKDKKAQELCFCDLLPKHLLNWLMRDPATQIPDNIESNAVNVISMVLTIDPSVIDLILERQGIIEIDVPNEDPGIDVDSNDDQITPQRARSQDRSAAEVPLISPDIITLSPHLNRRPSGASSEQVIFRQTAMAYHSPNSNRNRSPLLYSLHDHTAQDNMQYRTLLTRVLLAARRATFPSSGPLNMSELNEALSGEEICHRFDDFDGIDIRNVFHPDNQHERDKKIGAAGELYVFELLTRLDPALTDWSDVNWQSTIRRYVTIHPDYANMKPWYGGETADITYDDTEGIFTALLIDHGFFDAEEWRDKHPKYYIEVKTTTGHLRTPFYMSKYQYERMRAVHNRSDHSEVYMILRVFDICGDNIGMSVYLDPEQLRLDGGLIFTGETWSVVPG